MNENDISSTLHRDINLRDAIRRHEEKLPALPESLNKQILSRISQINESRQRIKPQKQEWTAIISAIAACLLLLITLKLTIGNPQQTTNSPSAITKVPKPVEKNHTIHPIENEHTSNIHVEIGKTSIEEHKPSNNPPKQTKEQTSKHLLTANQKTHEKEKVTVYSIHSDNKLRGIHVEGLTESISLRGSKEEKQAEENNQFKEAEAVEVYADTLGSEILQSPENKLVALQILSECEATIERETQEVRNSLIKATFNVVPPSRNAILVTDENGDYDVIDTSKKNIVEL